MPICPYTNCPHRSYCTEHGTICNGYLFEITKQGLIEEIKRLKEQGKTASEINIIPRLPIKPLRCTGCAIYEECSKGSVTTPLKEPQKPLELELKFKGGRIYRCISKFKYKRAKAKYPHNFKLRGSVGLCKPIHKLAQKEIKDEYGHRDEIFVDNWELFEDRSEDSEDYRSSLDDTTIDYHIVPRLNVSPIKLPLWSGRVEQKPFPDVTKPLLYISGRVTDLKYIRNTTDIFKVIIASGNPYRDYQIKGKDEWCQTGPGGSRTPVRPGFVVKNVVICSDSNCFTSGRMYATFKPSFFKVEYHSGVPSFFHRDVELKWLVDVQRRGYSHSCVYLKYQALKLYQVIALYDRERIIKKLFDTTLKQKQIAEALPLGCKIRGAKPGGTPRGKVRVVTQKLRGDIQELRRFCVIDSTEKEIILLKLNLRLKNVQIADRLGVNRMKVTRTIKKLKKILPLPLLDVTKYVFSNVKKVVHDT